MSLLSWLDDTIRDPASCRVRIDGREIDDLYPSLEELEVVLARQDSGVATLVFETHRVDNGRWNVQDDDRIRPWSAISVHAVFGTREDPIFDGFIRQVQVSFPEERGAAKVTVSCQDTSLLLDRTQRTQRWGDDVPLSDGQIVTRILQEAGLGFLDQPGEGVPDLVVNQNETDIKFLKKRAQENAFDLFFREQQLYFGPMRFDRSDQATIRIYAGTDTHCLSFNIDDDGHQPDAVLYEVAETSGSDTNEQRVTPNLDLLGDTPVNAVSSRQGDFAWRLSREGLADGNQARARAQAQANEASLKIKATGELDGALYGHVLLPGDPVGVDGIGDAYGGRWYVSQVSHRFDMNGYRQSFELLRNAYGDNLETHSNPLAAVL